MKRSLSLYEQDENTNEKFQENLASNKKQKLQPLSNSNSLGILSPPVTPENLSKTISFDNSKLAPVSKKLFSNTVGSNRSSTYKATPYSRAKNLFLTNSNPYSNENFILNGREKEATVLKSYIVDAITNFESTSIYISGPPGTGKSCQINALIDSFTLNTFSYKSLLNEADKIYHIPINDSIRKVRIVKINCMSISSPVDLYKYLYTLLTGKCYDTSKDSKQLFNAFKKNEDIMTLLVLDEMDNIINKSQQMLFELFTWASNLLDNILNPKIILVGIANALDLTDRFLPRLRANCICPKLVQFLPYTADQIKSVITGKLFSLQKNKTVLPPLVHPAAIQFCAKKSAVTTGDLRKAFDIMFKSLNLFELNLLKSKSHEEINNTSIDKLPKMMISQVVKICSESFNSNFDLKLKPLNLQQKVILSFLLKFEEKIESERLKFIKLKKSGKFNYIVSLNLFFEYYLEKCKDFDHLKPLKRSEFLEIISSFDTHGLITISMMNISSSTKSLISNSSILLNFDNFRIAFNIPKSEFIKNVNDIPLLKRIIYSNF